MSHNNVAIEAEANRFVCDEFKADEQTFENIENEARSNGIFKALKTNEDTSGRRKEIGQERRSEAVEARTEQRELDLLAPRQDSRHC